MTATFTLNILLSGIKEHSWGALSNPGLLNLGKFEDMPYDLIELPIFMLMGVYSPIDEYPGYCRAMVFCRLLIAGPSFLRFLCLYSLRRNRWPRWCTVCGWQRVYDPLSHEIHHQQAPQVSLSFTK